MSVIEKVSGWVTSAGFAGAVLAGAFGKYEVAGYLLGAGLLGLLVYIPSSGKRRKP